MSDDLHNIDDLFKKSLAEYEELPSGTVWENIDKSLDKKKVISIAKKNTTLKWAVAILLLISFGMAMYVVHIRLKNTELVKQNNLNKGLKKKSPPARNDLKDITGLNTVPNIKPDDKKRVEESEKQAGHKNIATSHNSGHHRDANSNAVAPQNSEDKSSPGDAGTQFSGVYHKDEAASKQDHKKASGETAVKNKLHTYRPPTSGTVNTQEDIITSPTAVNADEALKPYTPGESFSSSLDRSASLEEKYPAGMMAISELKDRLQELALTVASQPLPLLLRDPQESKPAGAPPNYPSPGKPVHLKINNTGRSLISLTAFFSPDLVSTRVRNDHPRFMEEDSHEIEKEEKVKFSSTVGILIDYGIAKNLKLESGVTFSTHFTDIEPKTIYARPDNNGNINYRFNCSAGYSFVTLKSSSLPPAYGDSISALSSKNVIQYISVPLAIKYVTGRGRFMVSPGVGISVNFLTNGKIETTIPTSSGNEKVTSNDIRGLKSTYFNGLASVGARYALNNTLQLAFTPSVRFALSSINKDAPVKTYLNSISFAAGITIKL